MNILVIAPVARHPDWKKWYAPLADHLKEVNGTVQKIVVGSKVIRFTTPNLESMRGQSVQKVLIDEPNGLWVDEKILNAAYMLVLPSAGEVWSLQRGRLR